MAVCHVDEGVTTYHYDEKHHITLYDRQGNLLEEQGDAWKKRYAHAA